MRFTMKKILFLVCALALYAFPAFAASPAHGQTPDGWPPALQADSKPAAPEAIPEIDYLNPKTVPLTDKEKKALRLSGSWSRQGVEPVLTGGGKVVYVHGASLPTIVAAPMQVCDVELQPGETVHEIVVGDSSRWMVDSGTAGSGASATAHLFIKPVDSGLESSAVVTTDRRVYHLRLVSQRSGHTPYVGFLYSESLKQQAAWKQARDAKEREWDSTTVDGKATDLSALNFNYEVKGKAKWKPERVYDDGRQTFIRLPEKSASGEMPVLLVRKGKQDVLVNYRVKDSAMIVDGLFDRIALIIGVGGDQEKVDVIRGSK
jgi:type IV secretion system protein TrbG